MLASTFDKLEDHQKDALTAYLENLYEIKPDDKLMMNFINSKAKISYSAWKYKCRVHYIEHGNCMPDEFKLRPEQWEYLVTKEFEDESKKALSKRNQSNRTKNPNPINHHSGPKPVSHRAEEYLVRGHSAPFVQAALDAYLPSKNGKAQVESLQRSLEEISQAWEQGASENAEGEASANPCPIPIEEQREILIKCLGERRCTEVRGLGGALRRPPKKRGGPWNQDAAEKRKELEERARKDEDEAKKARDESKKAKEEAKQANEKSDKVLDENESLRNCVAALEEFMTTFSKSQTSSPVTNS